MKVLVDTTAWTLLLRREPASLSTGEREHRRRLETLVTSWDALIIGPIRQEVLSGIRDPAVFDAVRDALAEIPDEPLEGNDFVRAAEAFNTCLRAGIAPTHTDMLVCAVAGRLEVPVFTQDRGFERFATVLGLEIA